MLDILQPHLVDAMGVAITLAVSIAAYHLKQWTGIQIEAKHRDALHSALQSGARAAVKGGAAEGLDVVVAAAIEHARSSVPDAIRSLGPGVSVLTSIAARYAADAVNGK